MNRFLWALVILIVCFQTAIYAQSPVVTDVLDGAIYTASIAPGGIFVVKGSNLSGSGYVAGAIPYSTTIAGSGVSITLSPAGVGANVSPYLVYTYNLNGVNQLAAILPSAARPMTYNLTVTFNGATSAPFKVTVLERKFGLITANGAGNGRAVIQNYISQTQLDVNRFTTFQGSGFTFSPSHPGQTLIAWGTGLGAIQKADNDLPGAIDFRGQVAIKVYVGGVAIDPAYAGRAPGLPGADQINFALPANIPTGCTVPFVVSVGGQMSNPTTIAIASNGSDKCAAPPFSADLLTQLDQGGSLTMAYLWGGELHTNTTIGNTPGMQDLRQDQIYGAFTRNNADQLADALVFLGPPNGPCQVFHRRGSNYAILWGGNATYLDAGTLTMSGGGVNQQLSRIGEGFYNASLGNWINPTPGMPVPPGYNTTPVLTSTGPYMIQATGGADISAFQISGSANSGGGSGGLNQGLPTDVVSRSSDLTISWTTSGVNPAIPLMLVGASGTSLGNDSTGEPMYDATVFACSATLSSGSITVPATVLQQLPAAGANNYSRLTLVSGQAPVSGNGLFTAPMKSGGNLDGGLYLLGTSWGQRPIYQ